MKSQSLQHVQGKQGSAVVLLIAVVALALVGVGVWYYKQQLMVGQNGAVVAPEPITQTVPQANPQPSTGCTEEAKVCPDGSTVGRVPPTCEFAQCPKTSDASSWKTYRNEQYGFEFKYPGDWIKEPGRKEPEEVVFQDVQYFGDVAVKYAQMHVEIEEKDADFVTMFQESIQESVKIDSDLVKPVTIAGKVAYELSEQAMNAVATGYVFFINNRMYSISTEIVKNEDTLPLNKKKTPQYYKDVFKQIIASFKFTK